MNFYKNDYENRALDGEYVLTPFLDFEEQKEILSEIKDKAHDQFEYLNPKADDFKRVYKDNTMICCEHEPGNELFIIQEGQIKITKVIQNKEVLLAVLKEGDIFGEMALIENKPRSASAIAFGTTKVMAVNKNNFEAMISNQPQLVARLISACMGSQSGVAGGVDEHLGMHHLHTGNGGEVCALNGIVFRNSADELGVIQQLYACFHADVLSDTLEALGIKGGNTEVTVGAVDAEAVVALALGIGDGAAFSDHALYEFGEETTNDLVFTLLIVAGHERTHILRLCGAL